MFPERPRAGGRPLSAAPSSSNGQSSASRGPGPPPPHGRGLPDGAGPASSRPGLSAMKRRLVTPPSRAARVGLPAPDARHAPAWPPSTPASWFWGPRAAPPSASVSAPEERGRRRVAALSPWSTQHTVLVVSMTTGHVVSVPGPAAVAGPHLVLGEQASAVSAQLAGRPFDTEQKAPVFLETGPRLLQCSPLVFSVGCCVA